MVQCETRSAQERDDSGPGHGAKICLQFSIHCSRPGAVVASYARPHTQQKGMIFAKLDVHLLDLLYLVTLLGGGYEQNLDLVTELEAV